MEYPILTRKTLENYSVIDKTGSIRCTVAATVRPSHLINGTEPYYVIYLRILTRDNLDALLVLLDEDAIIDYHSHSGYFMTGIIFDNQIKDGFDLPSKGSQVDVNIILKDEQLKVQNIELLPRYSLVRIDIAEVYPLFKLFKTYCNEKLGNKQEIPFTGRDTIPEL